MTKIVFHNLRMVLQSNDNDFSLDLCVSSGVIDFSITISLLGKDYAVIEKDEERAAFLQAALLRPFQLKDTWLTESEQRHYLDIILHAPKTEVELFLTEKDHGRANGAISNAMNITSGRDQSEMRSGSWFRL